MNADSVSYSAVSTSAQSVQEEPQKEEPKPDYSLQVSTDSMTAYLRVKPAYLEQVVSYEDILEYLKQQGITYGICESAIHSFCDEKKFYSELTCARGKPPVDGDDGVLTYYFDQNKELTPKQREDGTMDYHDLGIVRNVSKGDVLCSITPATTGTDGIDIYSRIVPFKPGRMPTLPLGTNTVVSEDQLSLLADLDGCIESTKTQININSVFIVRGDVDSASGNVVTNGSVIVQGDVRAGFSIKAGQDITVRGMVEGAMLEAKGSISISNGMNGMGKGVLKAGGNIVGKFFENASLECTNDIQADVMMNCRVNAGGSILLKGQRASLLGGTYQVGRRIVLKNVGTAGNVVTRISIQSKELSDIFASNGKSDMEVLNRGLAEAQRALDEFKVRYDAIATQITGDGQEKTGKSTMLLKAAILKKSQLSKEVDEITKQIEEYKANATSLVDYHLIGTGIIYSGTKLVIGPHTMNVNTDYSNSKFYADQDGVVFGPVLPSDIIN